METYFDSTYGMGAKADSLSTIEYVTDKRFEVVSCCFTLIQQPYADPEQATTFVAGEDAVKAHLEYLTDQYGTSLHMLTVCAQNATFDCTVLAKHYSIFPAHVIDLLGLARHQNARDKNDLASLCKRYGLKDKGDTSQFAGKTFRTRFVKGGGRKKGPKLPVQVPKITDTEIAALAEYNRNDNLREWELFTLLLPKLSNPKIELRLIQHHLELFTKPVLGVDFAKGDELIGLMGAEIEQVLGCTGQTREEISGDLSFARLLTQALQDAGDNPQTYFKPCKRGYKLADAKADSERELLLNHANAKVRALTEARAGIKSWPLHIERVKKIMAQARAGGGLLAIPLKYHGAHTGRASGGERINLQNLGSRGHELINAVRNLLVAVPSRTLVIADAAAIEARVLAWIAGQWDLVEKFANGQEIYCDFAAKVLGYHVRKPRKSGGIPAIESRMGWARNSVGKIGILGCGYGMGPAKTEGYAKGAIDFATAEKIVQVYRQENQQIVKFWKDIEKAFTYTAKYQRPCELARGLRFDALPDCDVVLTLPNGRELHYPKVKIVQDKYGDKAEIYNALEHKWEHTWGGTLTENVVQAMSRDVLMEAMLRLEDQGFHTALHVHDELVMDVAEAEGAERVLKLAIEELSRTPAWAPRLALAAEGVISDRYGKH